MIPFGNFLWKTKYLLYSSWKFFIVSELVKRWVNFDEKDKKDKLSLMEKIFFLANIFLLMTNFIEIEQDLLSILKQRR